MAVLERHQDLVDELIAEVEAYKPDVDRELLTRAFDYAARAHDGQVRRSGQEFIYHPWGAAKILAGLQLDEHAEAENYRKRILAMAEDLRVILIKLADRLHNLRTIEYLGKQKQVQKAHETP